MIALTARLTDRKVKIRPMATSRTVLLSKFVTSTCGVGRSAPQVQLANAYTVRVVPSGSSWAIASLCVNRSLPLKKVWVLLAKLDWIRIFEPLYGQLERRLHAILGT